MLMKCRMLLKRLFVLSLNLKKKRFSKIFYIGITSSKAYIDDPGP